MTSAAIQLNTCDAIVSRVKSGTVTWSRTLAMLVARLALFALFQLLASELFVLLGWADPWQQAIAWWPATVSLANLVTLALVSRALRREGLRYRDLVAIDRAHLGRDVLALLVLLIPIGPLGYFPNVWLGTALFGDFARPFEMMVRPLPMAAAVIAGLAFPLTQGLIELVTYFGYVMPRLEALSGRRWLAVSLAALFLGLQHIAVPLILDGRFMLWRALMFLPFALSLGLALRWRPRLMPFLMGLHALIDMSVSVYIFSAGY